VNLGKYLKDINAFWKESSRRTDPEGFLASIQGLMDTWLRDMRTAAENYISTNSVSDRDYVSTYRLRLWVWHHLEKQRWEMSRIPLRIGARAKVRPDVDHIVAFKRWECLFGQADKDGVVVAPDGTAAGVNDIGNMLLLESNFNIEKSDKPLEEFLAEVYEFKKAKMDRAVWLREMGIPPVYLNPGEADRDAVIKATAARGQSIKQELIEYVRGERELCF